MNARSLLRKKIIIAATTRSGFSSLVRCSGTSTRNHSEVIPIHESKEIESILPLAEKSLIVLGNGFQPDKAQEEFINEALARGAQWCSLKLYEGLQCGYANIHSLHDLLEWIHWQESSLPIVIFERLIVIIRRLVAAGLIIVLSPLIAFIWIAIKATSPGPALFRQARVGHQGKIFELVKFRTMRLNAEANGPQWSAGEDDPRLHAIGGFLRKTHLDELPQLWNIVCGHLCFVGPRPERPEFQDHLKKHIPHFKIRTRIRPGLTGWAQLKSGYAASVEESRIKVAHDIFFMRSKDLLFAASIVLETIKKCISEFMASIFKFIKSDN